MKHTCLNCGKSFLDNTRSWNLNDRRKGLPGKWQLAECKNCSVISMLPMPTDEQLAAYYSVYSPDEKIDLLPKCGSHYPLLRKLYHHFSGDVDPRDFVQVPQGARVLDYGCGLAGYLGDFHQRGIAISGAEIAGFVVDACRRNGFDVHKVDDFSHIPFADEEFDVVYLMQVFEHLRDPHAFMQELARILKSGGTLYLAVPNAASAWRKIFGDNWVSGWFAPFHLFHYNNKPLSDLAAQHGFDTLDSWSRTPESWFRLNIKAWLYSDENRLDERYGIIDSIWARIPLMVILRVMELFIPQRDCLVIKLVKRGNQDAR